jgi:hypothetical protein
MLKLPVWTEISDDVFQVDVGDMYAEETRDVIFEVTLVYPKTADDSHPYFPHAIVDLSYFDTIKHTLIGPLSCTALIARPNNNDLSWPDRRVAVQYMRVRTAKVIAEAWNLEQRGELDRAKQKLSNWIEEFQKEKFEIGSGEPLLDQLLVDLTVCLGALKIAKYDEYAENELGVRMQVSDETISYLSYYLIISDTHPWYSTGPPLSAMFGTHREEKRLSHGPKVFPGAKV